MPDSVENMLRQLAAGQAATQARLDEVVRSLEATQADAREARDLGNRIATRLEEQDIVGRLAEHRGEMRQVVAEIRNDVAAANTRLRRDLADEAVARKDLEARIQALEDARNQVVGVATFFSWLSRVAPWLVAMIASAVAALQWKGEG